MTLGKGLTALFAARAAAISGFCCAARAKRLPPAARLTIPPSAKRVYFGLK